MPGGEMVLVAARLFDAPLVVMREAEERLLEGPLAANDAFPFSHLTNLVLPLARDIQIRQVIVNRYCASQPGVHPHLSYVFD